MSKFLFEYQSFKNFRVLEDFMMPLDDAGIFVYSSGSSTTSYGSSSYSNNYYSGNSSAADSFFNDYFNPYSIKKKYRACFPNLEVVESIIESMKPFSYGKYPSHIQNDHYMSNTLKSLLPVFDINQAYGFNGEKLKLAVYYTQNGHIYKSNAPADLWTASMNTGKFLDDVAEFCMLWLPMFVNGTSHATLIC